MMHVNIDLNLNDRGRSFSVMLLLLSSTLVLTNTQPHTHSDLLKMYYVLKQTTTTTKNNSKQKSQTTHIIVKHNKGKKVWFVLKKIWATFYHMVVQQMLKKNIFGPASLFILSLSQLVSLASTIAWLYSASSFGAFFSLLLTFTEIYLYIYTPQPLF